MKRLIALIIVLGLMLGTTGVATAATGTEKQAAIDAALAWLATQQQGNGSWLYSGGGPAEHTAATAAALLAFIEEKGKPAGWAADYTANVENGIAFLLAQAQIVGIGPQPAGNPDSDNNQVGVKFVLGGLDSRDTYVTGLVIPAIAKYIVVFSKANDLVPSGPLAVRTDGSGAGGAWTYRDIVVNTLDYFAFGQNDSGSARGGWRYYANYGSSDNSTAQWPVIAMLFASEPGVNAPAFVKNELAYWVEYIQNANGGSGYDSPTYLVNEAKTGGLLVEMIYAEDDTVGTPYNLTNTDLLAALTYLNNNWLKLPASWDGNIGHPYAMWSIYKGLEVSVGKEDTTYLTNLRDQTTARSGGPAPLDPGVDWTWWEDYCEYLFSNQNPSGYWPGYSSWTGPLATAWYINILQGVRIPPPTQCAIIGDDSVIIQGGTHLQEGTQKPNACSNGLFKTGSKVFVMDDADLKAHAAGGQTMILGDGNLVSGSVLNGADMRLGAQTVIDGDAHADGDLALAGGAEVLGTCHVSGAIDYAFAASCGAVDNNPTPVNEFSLPTCEVVALGGEDLQTGPKTGPHVLPAGDYGDVVYGSGNTVVLTGGKYTFKSLKFGAQTKVEIQAPILVEVENALTFQDGVEETLTGGTEATDVVYLVNGDAAADPSHGTGAKTVVYGTLCGPSSTITIGSGSYFEGAIYGKDVHLGAKVTFIAAPATLP